MQPQVDVLCTPGTGDQLLVSSAENIPNCQTPEKVIDWFRVNIYIISSWWLNQPISKNISQIGSFPQVRVEIKNYLKPPPRYVLNNCGCLDVSKGCS